MARSRMQLESSITTRPPEPMNISRSRNGSGSRAMPTSLAGTMPDRGPPGRTALRARPSRGPPPFGGAPPRPPAPRAHDDIAHRSAERPLQDAPPPHLAGQGEHLRPLV